MCGIVGIYSSAERVTHDELRRMNATITHRGPDDEGYLIDGPVGLAMRRLSIIDLAGGHQPISNEDGTCSIVYNGEIYNHRELRSDLERRGHRFRTHSDTEVIVHQYEETGRECPHAFNGMFGFAIWDAGRQVLLLARDRLGIKPLYYYWDGRTLVFGSELKAVLASPRVPRELEPESVWNYLSFRYTPAPMTMWRGVHKLPPGHTLRLDVRAGTLDIERYWDIRYDDAAPPADPAADLAHFSSLFSDAVERRLIADVPVGILLSGGLDSSAVAAAVSEVHNARLSTFSVAFEEGGRYNETGWAREVAAHLGTDHHEIVIGYREFSEFLPDFVWHTDEPLADPASIPLFYLSRLAAGRVKVVLSGEGADEVLAGYNFEQIVGQWERLARFQRLPQWLRQALPRAAGAALGRTALLERLDRGNVPVVEYNRTHLPYMSKVFSHAEKRALWPDAPDFPDADGILRGYYERARTRDPLHQLLYAYCQDWLVEDLLMKADKMTMANSLELRVPFLDYRLVEWLASRPSSLKVGRGGEGRLETKHLLRRFAATRLPASILDRPKLGFPVPLESWMRGELGRTARLLLLGDDSRIATWFDRNVLADVVRQGTTASDSAGTQRLWVLLVLELWARRWA